MSQQPRRGWAESAGPRPEQIRETLLQLRNVALKEVCNHVVSSRARRQLLLLLPRIPRSETDEQNLLLAAIQFDGWIRLVVEFLVVERNETIRSRSSPDKPHRSRCH